MKRHTFRITLKLRGPVLTKSSSPAAFGVDSAVARVEAGPDAGKPCLPGSLIRGKVRESFHQLWGEKAGNDLLGKKSADNTDNEPARGRLILGDLVHSDLRSHSSHRHRIAIEPSLGSVKAGALQVIECPFAAGEEADFAGKAWFYGTEEGAEEAKRKLHLSLQWLCQIGANRTSGFGEVLAAIVTDGPDAAPPNHFTTTPDSLDVTLTPLGPLCIAKHKIGDNLFESETFIPGNMLAGAVMETAKALGIDIPWFDSIRFRHAYPTIGSARPGALPLSLVQVGKDLLQVGKDLHYDVADVREPVLLKNSVGEWQAPAFMVDWKSWAEAEAKYGLAGPERELRVRTKIDSSKRTADRGEGNEGGSLFAWEMIHPFDSTGAPVSWRSCIDLSGIANEGLRAEAANALAKVLAQLGFLSKTKALCTAEVNSVKAPSAPEMNDGGKLRLTLQSPAMLADPRFQNIMGIPKSGALSAGEMFQLYAAVWDELSGHSLTLSHHYAQQSLAGGNYLATRFQKTKRGKYDPWLLTSAGSVFVFHVENAAAAVKKLEVWLGAGLPLPAWAIAEFGDNWEENPYLPQNGFGEIAIHEFRFDPPADAQPIACLATPLLPDLS